MTEDYCKLVSGIVLSSIWDEDDRTRIVWITMLALKNRNHEVLASLPGLARAANVPLESCQQALTKLLAPDPYSRSPEHDGRRIEAIDGGWRILNGEKYRNYRSKAERTEYQRVLMAKRRKKGKQTTDDVSNVSTDVSNVSTDVSNVSTPLAMLAKAEAEAEAEAEAVSPIGGGGANGEPCTIDDCVNHANFIGLPQSEAEAFYNYYSSVGWMLGGSPVRAWKNLLINWKVKYEQRKHQDNQRGGRPRVDRNKGTYNEGHAHEY